MKLATSTGDLTSYTQSHEERIELIHKCGFKYIDLSFYEKDDNTAFLVDKWQSYTLELSALAKKLGISFVQAHSMGGNPLDKREGYDYLLRATIRSIEVCAILGIPYTVVHSGWCPGIAKDEYFRRNLDFYKKLFPVMESTGVSVLIENSTRANMGNCWYYLTGQDMKDFLEYADHPLLGACWDTGHANIEGHQYEDIVTLGNHLRAIHFNDNNGECDQHIMPYMGTMSIDEIMCGLIDSSFSGIFTFECNNNINPGSSWPYARRTFQKETRAYMPPLEIKLQAEKMMLSIGKNILEKYSIPIE